MSKNDFRVTTIFKTIIRFVRKMLSFVGKHLKFLTNKCLFIFCIFYLHEEELNQQVCLIKYVENEISNSTLHKKEKERERPAKT